MSTLTHRALAPTRQVLSNDLVVIAKQARMTPAVTILAAFRAGSAGDPPGGAGLAHFLSRVIDRGTATRSAEDIAEALDSRGVSLSLGVTRHALTIGCTCLSEDFHAMLELIGDISMHPSFPESEIATRRGEIITSIRQDEDSPAVTAVEALMELLYPDEHPYGRRAKGTIERVEAIDRKELLEFHGGRFAPSTLSLAIVGDVEEDAAVEAADRIFRDWRAAPLPQPGIPALPRHQTRRRVVRSMMNKAQADIAYGFVAIKRADPAFYAHWIMNNALGQYALGGRLGDSIRERQGMAYYVFSSLDANVGEGPLTIRAGVNPANVDRAIDSIDQEIVAALSPGFTEREVAESQRYLIGSLPRSLETNAGIASFLQSAEFFGLGVDYDERLPGLLNAVTRADVQAAAERVLSTARASIVVAGPYEDHTLTQP